MDSHFKSKLNLHSVLVLGHDRPFKDLIHEEYIILLKHRVVLVLENILTLTFAVGQGRTLNNHFDIEVECWLEPRPSDLHFFVL